MWLGIVLHVGAIHTVAASPLPWRDEQRTPVADLLTAFIHSFRMPLFFILAGFFLAMLLHGRGPRAVAIQRLKRLALPFALFWPFLYVSTGLLVLAFMHRIARGTWGLDWALRPQGPTIPEGPGTMHLWFLWMLIWFSLGAVLLTAWRPAWRMRISARMHALLRRLGLAWWGVVLLAQPLVVAGWGYPNGLLLPSGLFLPPWPEWLHNGLFFVFGLSLYRHQGELFELYRRRWVAYALAGLPFFLATGTLVEHQAAAGWTAFAYNSCAWLWSFALLGAALRFMPAQSRTMAYLADSSYWVYLVHLPMTIGFGAMLYGLPLPALLKMAINIGATTIVCLLTYHFAVRPGWLGALLTGKRHPRRAAPSDTDACALPR